MIFEYLTDSYSLFDNPIYNYIIMAIVGWVAYLIAYNVVGDLYCLHFIRGREIGSFLHWFIRLIVFVAIYYTVATAILICKWVMGVPTFVWWIVLAVIVGIDILIVGVGLILKRKENNLIL